MATFTRYYYAKKEPVLELTLEFWLSCLRLLSRGFKYVDQEYKVRAKAYIFLLQQVQSIHNDLMSTLPDNRMQTSASFRINISLLLYLSRVIEFRHKISRTRVGIPVLARQSYVK